MGIMEGIIIVLSYLLGCFNTGYYYTRIFYRQDIRAVGTNVTGAMNVSRLAGKKGFLITFLGDALKGALPVMVCRILKLSDIVTMTCILMVITGHIFPFQLKLKGGKGLSTAFGAYLVFNPFLILYLSVTCIVLFPLIRRYTITCLSAFILLPIELLILGYSGWVVFFFFINTVVIILACRNNFKEYFNKTDKL